MIPFLKKLKSDIQTILYDNTYQLPRLFTLFILVLIWGNDIYHAFLFLFLIHGLFSYASVLGILLLSDLIRNSPVIDNLPFVHLTVVYYAVFLVYSIFFLYFKPNYKPKLFGFLLLTFAGLSILSIAYSPVEFNLKNPLQNRMLAVLVFYIPTSLFILFSRVIITKKNFLEKFTNTVLNISILWLGLGLHNYVNKSDLVYITTFGEDYMQVTSQILFIFMYVFVSILKPRKYILLLIIIGLAGLVSLLLSPARGLTIGTITSCLLLITAHAYHNFKLKAILLRLGIIAVSVFILISVYKFTESENLTPMLNRSVARLLDYNPEGHNVSERIRIVKDAFTDWSDSPYLLLGAGYVELKNGPGLYTHNIILEVIFEFGILGLPFLIYYIGAIYLFVTNLFCKFNLLSAETKWLLALCLIFFIFSMFSLTLGNMKINFILFALSIRILYNLNNFKHVEPKS